MAYRWNGPYANVLEAVPVSTPTKRIRRLSRNSALPLGS